MTRTLRTLLVIVASVVLGYALRTYVDAQDEQAEPAPRAPTTAVLHVTSLKDGDSWDASDGREYRLGLVNTPEPSEPCFREARQFTGQFLAGGFRANAYGMDVHGRHVAEVFDPAGRSLNVALAKSGLADGKYLNNFRHENPELAKRVEDALASAAKPACRVP